MTYYQVVETDTTNTSVPISGMLYKLGCAYDLVQGDKEGGLRRIIRIPDQVCVWSTNGGPDPYHLTTAEKTELSEHMCDLAQHMLTRLYQRKPDQATINWIDPIVRDTVTAKFPDCHVYPSEEYTPTQMYFTLEHVFNEFIALNSYKLYYHKLHSDKMHFVGTCTNRDPLTPLIKQEQYMAVFKKGPQVFRYFVTREAGPVEVIPLNQDDEPFNKKLSNIVNVVMASVDYPTFSDEED